MRHLQRFVVVVVLSVALAGNAFAIEEPTERRKPAPGAALAAAALNLVFMPMRVALTVVFAELGGLTGFLTGGNRDAASDIWNLVGGGNYITPEFIEGKEPLYLDSYHEAPVSDPDVVDDFGFGFPFEPALPEGRDSY